MLSAKGSSVPLLASMVLFRIAHHGAELVNAIVACDGIEPLIKILVTGAPASKQMAAAIIAAIGMVRAEPPLRASWCESSDEL